MQYITSFTELITSDDLKNYNHKICRVSGKDYILLREVIYLYNMEMGETSARSERKVSDKT
jgi:hypothetical protein